LFSIEFIADADPRNPDNKRGGTADSTASSARRKFAVAPGRIILGSFVDRFDSPMDYWQREQYEQQWCSAASRLFAGCKRTALITAMYDLRKANLLP
jgi:hypothetical protein